MPIDLNEAEVIVNWKKDRLGSFYTALMDAVTKADSENLDRLEAAYPVHVNAWRNFKSTPGWWGEVEGRFMR